MSREAVLEQSERRRRRALASILKISDDLALAARVKAREGEYTLAAFLAWRSAENRVLHRGGVVGRPTAETWRIIYGLRNRHPRSTR